MSKSWITAGIVFAMMGAHADTVTLTGDAAYAAAQKGTCGTTEPGIVRYGFWEGRAYSRVPGEKDRHLFNVMGVNVRQCGHLQDEIKGRGFRSVSREIMVYMDPDTGEVIDRWENPWTGKTVDVLHVANDPVNMRAPRFEFDKDGKSTLSRSFRRYGDMAVSSYEIPLFYDNPLAGDYQQYVGGTYHAMEIFDTFYDAHKMLDGDATSVGDSRLAWVRVAQWLPWLEMGSKPGLMVFNATGFSTFDKASLPKALIDVVDARFPEYWTPPPANDPRPNETSWTVFQKWKARQDDE
ncbi:MAG: DUF1838 family protein [Pseudomonadota bacterium]